MFPIPFMLIGKVVGCTALSFATHQVLKKVFIPAPAASGVLPDEVRQEIEKSRKHRKAGEKFMEDAGGKIARIKEDQDKMQVEAARDLDNLTNNVHDLMSSLTNKVHNLDARVKTIEEHNNNAKGFLEELRRRTERSW